MSKKGVKCTYCGTLMTPKKDGSCSICRAVNPVKKNDLDYLHERNGWK